MYVVPRDRLGGCMYRFGWRTGVRRQDTGTDSVLYHSRSCATLSEKAYWANEGTEEKGCREAYSISAWRRVTTVPRGPVTDKRLNPLISCPKSNTYLRRSMNH